MTESVRAPSPLSLVINQSYPPPARPHPWQSSQAQKAPITKVTKMVWSLSRPPTHTNGRENADRSGDIPWKKLLWTWMERALIFFCAAQRWLHFKDAWSWPLRGKVPAHFLLWPTQKAIQQHQVAGGRPSGSNCTIHQYLGWLSLSVCKKRQYFP